ncbi:pyruvate dehydrogenase (acetyl-transferring) E1 component subunit alpha [Actinomadura livida]|uniref:Pyruvate dehydrogenase (Acetyl-transferring) E1 component subunit alpha n=1 Tax=Actinomadura livida TaxID=79909 RepID=A0A7W7MXE0_9ACTN|nr:MULTISPECIES: pyruvate dehydrogenase (acetyl-transferring) E1 component subunit alpha [Actinomadura]MBB4774578.1 pyruvate dehydrogenase E1 component alpha subunit [Actinomadura catellatispora]GGU07344.1 pyruvate dehydrogenase E1 component subunit alpha [Actinomadura livida]
MTGRVAELLPSAEPVRFLTDDGAAVRGRRPRHPLPEPELLRRAYRAMVIGRRFDAQATALTKQGRLAVYPSSHGQEACQVGAVLALDEGDWFFPTYRESVALVTRGIDPVEVLALLRGSEHCGYDPERHHVAPQCTPLATQTVHAAGLAYAERRKGTGRVALVCVGDGATSEGDFHEALNFAAVFKAPVVFFVQNNQYAISVPLERQTAAPSLAHKGIGYGVRSERVDGNDPVAVLAVLAAAVEHARSGEGPFLVEAHTYRLESHTNADDASRYRTDAEAEQWRRRDPVTRLERYLRRRGHLSAADISAWYAEAEEFAGRLRDRMNTDPELAPLGLFDHVYGTPTPQLEEQRALLRAEIEAEEALS